MLSSKPNDWPTKARAVGRHYVWQRLLHPEWTATQAVAVTSRAFEVSEGTVWDAIAIARYLNDPEVANCTSLRAARRFITGRRAIDYERFVQSLEEAIT